MLMDPDTLSTLKTSRTLICQKKSNWFSEFIAICLRLRVLKTRKKAQTKGFNCNRQEGAMHQIQTLPEAQWTKHWILMHQVKSLKGVIEGLLKIALNMMMGQ